MYSEPSLTLLSQLRAELIWPAALLNFLYRQSPQIRVSKSAQEAIAISTLLATTTAIYMLIVPFVLGF